MPRALRVASLAAALGGLLWLVKAGVILAGGEQPLATFPGATVAFGVAVLALALAVPPAPRARAAAALGALAMAAGSVALAGELLPREGLDAANGVAVLAVIVALLVVDKPARPLLPRRWEALPLVVALAFPILGILLPALVTGAATAFGVEESRAERWIEVPLAALALAWLVLAYALWPRGRKPESEAEPRRVQVTWR